MGSLNSKSKRTTDQRTSENVTQTPTVAPWLSDATQGLVGRINTLGAQDPQSFVAGASPLQQSAFERASQMFAPGAANPANDTLNTATSMLTNAGNAPANTAQGVTLGPAAQWQAPTMAPAAQAQAQGYTASQAQAGSLGPAAQAQAHSVLDNGGIAQYESPYTQSVVDTTLASADVNAERARAQQLAQGARNGALGGSRFGIAEGILGGELARERASLEAGLRDRGFTQAAGLAQFDTAGRNAASMFNTGQTNSQDQYRAGLQTQTNLANLSAREAASQFGANAFNVSSMYNTGQTNAQAALQAQLAAQAASEGAGANNQFALTQGSMDMANNQFNAGQGDIAANRGLQAGLGLGQLGIAQGDQSRQDLAMLAGLGNEQRNIAQQQAMSPLALAQFQAQALGGIPYGPFTSQNTVGTGTMQGTETVRNSPSLFNQILAGASLFG